MISPMPFWPSLEPWKKLTRVQVRIRMPRIHHGGGLVADGPRRNSAGRRAHQHRAQHVEQDRGECGSRTAATSAAPLPILAACDQSHAPRCRHGPRSSALVIPTPMIDPIKVCEEDAGRPRYQVPRFQMMAAINSANTMAKAPRRRPTCRIKLYRQQRHDAEGDRARRQQARRSGLNMPDHTTAMWAGSERV